MNPSSPSSAGERMIPGAMDWRTEAEHLHRYALALEPARDKIVLDAAAGEGYGAALLASRARRVIGVERDPATTRAARKKYAQPNLHFIVADAARLPLRTGAFDFAASFETIEHLPDPAAFVAELRRVLAPNGALLLSTPDKQNYSDRTGHKNPFHTREFYRDEFLALVSETFPGAALYSQQSVAGSVVVRQDTGPADNPVQFSGSAREIQTSSLPAQPMFHIVVHPPTLPLPALSLFDAMPNLRAAEERLVHQTVNNMKATASFRFGHAIVGPLWRLKEWWRHRRGGREAGDGRREPPR